MDSETALVSVRPHRFAIFVSTSSPNWKTSCLNILSLANETWGGHGSIVIPTDGVNIDPTFWALLEAFEPDELYFYRQTGRDVLGYAPKRFSDYLSATVRNWESQVGEMSSPGEIQHFRENLLNSSFEAFSITDKLRAELKERLAPFHHEDMVIQAVLAEHGPHYPTTATLDVLGALDQRIPAIEHSIYSDVDSSLWSGGQLGYATHEVIQRLSAVVTNLSFRMPSFDEAVDLVFQSTPGFAIGKQVSNLSDLSIQGLGLYTSVRANDYLSSTLVVAGDTLEDFCFYHCLSRMRVRVVWLPPWIARGWAKPDHKERLGELRDSFYFVSALNSVTAYSNTYAQTVEMTSLSLNKEETDELIASLGSSSLHGDLRWKYQAASAFLDLSPSRLYDVNNVKLPTVVYPTSHNIVPLFPSRKPKAFSSPAPQKIRWVSEVSFPRTQLPRHPDLGDWLTTLESFEARTSRNAVCFLNVPMLVMGGTDSEVASTRPDIRLPDTTSLIRRIAEKRGFSCNISDKGIYAESFIAKLGGLERAATFCRSEIGQDFIAAYQDPLPSTRGFYLSDDKRLYLNFQQLTAICGDTASTSKLLDEFHSSRVMYRGFILQCEFCRRTSWYAVQVLRDTFTCKRCYRDQVYTSKHSKGSEQPEWYHQLDEVIYQAVRSHCHIPILSLSALSLVGSGVSFANELAYKSDVFSVESDLNCVVDGLLTLGETKKQNCLGKTATEERRVADRYRQLAERLGARQVVFATEKERWRAETQEIINAAFASSGLKTKLLSRADLYRSDPTLP